MRSHSGRRKGRARRRAIGQRGWTLIELAIAAAVATFVVALAAGRLAREVEDAAAQATGHYLLAVKGAADSYLAMHAQALAREGPVAGVARPLAPTWAELGAAGLLPPGLPERTPLSQAVAIRILRGPACPDAPCRLDALIHTTAPVRASPGGPVAPDLVAAVLMATAGHGGASHADQPGLLRGAGFAVPNPMGAIAGIVAVLASFDSSPFASFVRMRDERDPDLQGALSVRGAVASDTALAVRDAAGNDCVSATSAGRVAIRCAGRLDAKTGLFTSDGGQVVQIDPATGIVASQRVRAERGLATAHGSVFDASDAQPTIRVQAGQMVLATSGGLALTLDARDLIAHAGVSTERLGVREVAVPNTACLARLSARAGNHIEYARTAAGGLLACIDGQWRALGDIGATGGACAPNGAFATDGASGTGLVCRLGVWMRADDLFSSYVMVGSRLVSNLDLVPLPACGQLGTAVGTPLIYLVPQNESSQAAAFTRRAVLAGTSWRIQLLDYDGGALGGPARAIAQIYCKY